MKKIDNKHIYINRQNLVNNFDILKKRAGKSQIMSVIKGDAYGHGIQQCSDVLKKNGCKHFYVARLDDAINLRKKYKKNINIYLLSGTISKEICGYIKRYEITPIINNLIQLEIFNKFIPNINFVLHFDTGMNRLGFKIDEISRTMELSVLKNIQFLMTHLSSADEQNLKECQFQLNQLKKINKFFNKPLSIANSSGIFIGKAFHLNYARPGKSLYGINPFLKKSFGLKGVMSIYAPILQFTSIKKGQTLGYNKTFKAKKNIKVATIDFGYSDGYLRSGSNNAKVFIDGIACKVLGRVSMDLITIDVSNVDENNLYLGKPVEILGENQSCEDLALELGTNEHEILISLGKNFKKVYI
ncbi:alanine racemase [Alphaproteobacteria bacterium]|jgi:alanine racemase|nr:alanine racemase [Alphaproteobacteria bacterium]